MSKFEYIKQYEILHENEKDYGASAKRYFPEISVLIDYLQPKTILDYGCGKGTLDKLLQEKYPNIKIYQYDPAILEYNTLPVDKADMIICQDVLEHIPENILPEVIKEISTISKNVYFNINHIKSGNILPNGEDAHCTIKPNKWFKALIEKYFDTTISLRSRSFINSVIITFDIDSITKEKFTNIINSATLKMYQNTIKDLREKYLKGNK